MQRASVGSFVIGYGVKGGWHRLQLVGVLVGFECTVVLDDRRLADADLLYLSEMGLRVELVIFAKGLVLLLLALRDRANAFRLVEVVVGERIWPLHVAFLERVAR